MTKHHSPNSDILKSPEQAARQLGLGVSTLARWRLEGVGPRFLKLGRAVRYRQGDIETWLIGQTRQSTSEEVA